MKKLLLFLMAVGFLSNPMQGQVNSFKKKEHKFSHSSGIFLYSAQQMQRFFADVATRPPDLIRNVTQPTDTFERWDRVWYLDTDHHWTYIAPNIAGPIFNTKPIDSLRVNANYKVCAASKEWNTVWYVDSSDHRLVCISPKISGPVFSTTNSGDIVINLHYQADGADKNSEEYYVCLTHDSGIRSIQDSSLSYVFDGYRTKAISVKRWLHLNMKLHLINKIGKSLPKYS